MEINQQLADLQFRFGKNRLDSEKQFSYLFDRLDSIKDMHADDLQAAKARAEKN